MFSPASRLLRPNDGGGSSSGSDMKQTPVSGITALYAAFRRRGLFSSKSHLFCHILKQTTQSNINDRIYNIANYIHIRMYLYIIYHNYLVIII